MYYAVRKIAIQAVINVINIKTRFKESHSYKTGLAQYLKWITLKGTKLIVKSTPEAS